MNTDFLKTFGFNEVKKPISELELSKLKKYFFPHEVPDQLERLLKTFNGTSDIAYEDGFHSGLRITNEHKQLVEMSRSINESFPRSLVPFYSVESMCYFLKTKTGESDNDFVWSMSLSAGDHEIVLEYENLKTMIKTLLEERLVASTNKYRSYSEHYVDNEKLDAIQLKFNPNMYQTNQNGEKSLSGVKNIYEVNSLNKLWS